MCLSSLYFCVICYAEVKVEVGYLLQRCLHESDSRPEALLVLEVAADWQESMIPRRITRLTIACANNSWTRGAAHRHTTAPISHTGLHSLYTLSQKKPDPCYIFK